MAQSLHQFEIDDDSPEIAYFPFANLEPSPNVTAGWELLYTASGAATGPGQVGVGTSYHYTTLNGASLMINWTGICILLVRSDQFSRPTQARVLTSLVLLAMHSTIFPSMGLLIPPSLQTLSLLRLTIWQTRTTRCCSRPSSRTRHLPTLSLPLIRRASHMLPLQILSSECSLAMPVIGIRGVKLLGGHH